MYFSPKTSADGLVFHYDTGNTVRSYLGEPTVNYVPGTYGYTTYAYVSGPVDTTALNEKNQSITAKRYTITNAINTARAAIFPSGLATGVAYTFSFKWKYNGTTTASPSVGIDASKGNPEGGANNNSFTSATTNTVSIGNGWYLSTYTFVFSSIPTGNCMLTFGIVTGTTAGYVGETFDIYEAQFEIKNHRTQYSNGTRSATQGLKDLTAKNTIDISTVSFDANAQMTFDGTDDEINTGITTQLTDFSCEVVFKNNNSEAWGRLVDKAYTNGFFVSSYFASYGAGYVGAGIVEPNPPHGQALQYDTSKYNYFVVTRSGTTHTIYLNGSTNSLSKTGSSATLGTAEMAIGAWYGSTSSQRFTGEIPVVKLYNRALTADEVARNYNAIKSRFNIA